MLFEGKDILPKAPTPMTAALTKISYSDAPKARIVFYDVNDWNSIAENARKYGEKMDKLYEEYVSRMEQEKKKSEKPILGARVPVRVPVGREEFEKGYKAQIPMDYRACKEVWDMAKAQGLNVNGYLGKEELIESGSEGEYDYLERLNEYVGAEGRFTAIVKYTEIQLPNKMLEGIEVIDTPGLNDPIISRSRITRKFLIECDVVFLLAYCGQFLGADDMAFIMSSLPGEGINKAVLIGSKLDSAILQYNLRNASFKQAYLGTVKNCEDQAADNIRDCSVTAYNGKLLQEIKKSLPPKCISSVAYSAALQMREGKRLGIDEKHMVDNLCRRFSDFDNSVDTLFGLSNIPDVKKEVFEKTKSEKEQIIKDRISELAHSQVVKFQGILEDISIQVRRVRNDVEKYDREQLEKRLEENKETLHSARQKVKNVFMNAAVDSKRRISEIVIEIKREIGEHLDIDTREKTKTKHHSKESGHLWWKTETQWDEIITTHIAEVNDVETNMREYLLKCEEIINSEYQKMLNIDGSDGLKNKVKQAVMGIVDRSDSKFDEDVILNSLEIALKEITLPFFEMKRETYEAMLDQALGGKVSNGVVKNEDIPLLKRVQDKVLEKISEDVKEKVRKDGEEIDRNLQRQAAEFIDDVVKSQEGYHQELMLLIKDKQASIEKLEEFLNAVVNAKEMLHELEA